MDFSEKARRDEIAKLRELKAAARMPAYPELGDSLRAEIEAHNGRVAEMGRQFDAAYVGLESELAAATDGNYGELFAAIDTLKIRRADVLQALASLLAEKERLAESAVEEFAARVAPAESEAAETVAAVTADFERLGSGLAAMPSHGVDSRGAEDQLRWLVENRNLRTRAAISASHDAKNLLAAATSQLHAAQAARKSAHDFVIKTARQMAAGV